MPEFKSWIILKSCYWIAEAIWNTEHLPNLAYDNAWWALIIPPVAIISASFKRSSFAKFVATLKAIGLNTDPQAPPKKVDFYGPTAGYGSRDWSGSIKEYIVLVAETPDPPAFKTERVIF